MRRLVLAVHRWLGLVAGLLLGVVALTGTLAAFRPELESLVAAPSSAAVGRADLDAVVAALGERWPGARVASLTGPGAWGAEALVWNLQLPDPAAAPGERRPPLDSWKAWTDPATGDLLGHGRGSAWCGALAWVARFHHNLAAGQTGTVVVGSTGFLAALFAITGLWLWWPRRGGWHLALRVRWRAGRFLRWWDLHRVVGAVAVPLLLLTGLSGALLEFRWLREGAHRWLGGGAADLPFPLRAKADQPRSGPGRAQGWGQALAAAEAAAPGRALSLLLPPRGPEGAWTAVMASPAGGGALSGLVLAIERGRPAMIDCLDPAQASVGGWLAGQAWGLHVGAYAGLPTRILHALAGLLPAFLLITGWWLWWRRRSTVPETP
jgi:uncharacterized iron-regulated membrane protein